MKNKAFIPLETANSPVKRKFLRGFTTIEVMIVVAALGLLSGVAVPSFVRARDRARDINCLKNRRVVEDIEALFTLDQGQHTSQLADLVSAGYLKKLPSCPSGGTWSWWGPSDPQDPDYKAFLRCSVHGVALPVGKDSVAVLNGVDYSKMSSSWAWSKDGNDMYSSWGSQWLEYKSDFKDAGAYKLTVAAKNNPDAPGQGTYQPRTGWSIVDGYKNFMVAVYVDGKNTGTVYIPASDKTYNTGELSIQIPKSGAHDIRLVWLNDAYNPGKRQDVNIQIHTVSIEKAQ